MKILYMTERFHPFIGGIETMSIHLLSALQSAGHQIQIVTSQSAKPMAEVDSWQGIPLFRLPMLPSLQNRDIKGILETRSKLRKIKQDFAPDIVHIQFSGPSSMFHWDTQGERPVPTLVTVHSVMPTGDGSRSLYLDTVRKADWVAPVSQHMLDWTLERAPDLRPHSSVVYNGLPADELPAEPAAIPTDQTSLLWVGRMVDWKRVDRLIDAFAILATDHPQLRLVLAGDGPMRADLEGRVAQHGLQDSVHFTGWVDAKTRHDLLKAATMFVIPSEPMENLPMAALEAAAFGKVIVGSDVSGLPEIVEHGRSGLLLDNPTPAAFAAAMGGLLDDRERLAGMGQCAFAKVRERFSCARMSGDYLALYHKIKHQAVAA